jgi:selenide,water dikinase
VITTSERVRLTSFASGGGCATKIAQSDLLRLIGEWPELSDERIVVGPGTGDDAAVIDIGAGRHLVFTTDFFAPIVDDAADYGAIAATNALSDVYAMGGEPLAALNIVAWPPEDVLAFSVLRDVLDAARATVTRAGATVVGGHSVKDAEPKFGLAVVGTVAPGELMTNDRGSPGDVLLLTKPLGTGVVANALKHDAVDVDVLRDAVESMTRLNADASRLARRAGVRCATDVTGFGLLGHLHALCAASRCGAEVDAAALPVLAGVRALVEQGLVPGGSRRNRDYAAQWTVWDDDVDEWLQVIATDAQTSGGLLLAAGAGVAEALQSGDVGFTPFGRLVDSPDGLIHVFGRG